MEFPQNFHGQSAFKVWNDIHKFKNKNLLHKCHTESTVAALKWIVLCNRVANATTAAAQMQLHAAQVRRRAAWVEW
jgi:hypothetical protein